MDDPALEKLDSLLADFVPRMRYKLVKNLRKFDRWESTPASFMLKRLGEEMGELMEAVARGQSAEEIALECADISNVAAMVAKKFLEEERS